MYLNNAAVELDNHIHVMLGSLIGNTTQFVIILELKCTISLCFNMSKWWLHGICVFCAKVVSSS